MNVTLLEHLESLVKIHHCKVEWKCAFMVSGEQLIIPSGRQLMHVLSVECLDTHQSVRSAMCVLYVGSGIVE